MITKEVKDEMGTTTGEPYAIDKEDLFQILDTVNMWIENCDNKAATILATIGIVASVIFSSDVVTSLKSLFKTSFSIRGWNQLFAIGMLLSFIFMLLGIIFLVLVITPRLVYSYTHQEQGRMVNSDFPSVMFYGKVSKQKSVKDYRDKVDKADEESVRNDLCFQILSASKICKTKFQNLKHGLAFFFIGLLLFIIFLFVQICI